jgi:hypothetical protein
MNPEDTSNAHSLFGDRGVGPTSSSSGGGGGSGGLSLAQQLQYQQLLHQQMQMQQQQLHEQQQQQQQQSLGIMSSSTGGGVPQQQQQQQRDLALEQYAASRQQAIREAVLSQPYTLNSASLLQQNHPQHQQPSPYSQQQQSQSYNPMVMAQGSGSSMPYSSSSNAMGFLPGLMSQQLPPHLGSNKADASSVAATGHTSLVQPGHLPQAPSSAVSLSREESMLVEEAVLRGLPLEDVFRAAGMSTFPNHPTPSSASMMMPPPPPSQQASATALARRLSSMEQTQPLGFGGGGGGGTGRSLGSPPFMSGLDPSHVIAQRELLLSTAAAASNSASSATSSSSQHGSDPAWWLPPAKRSRRSSDTLHDALKKHKKKTPPPPSSSTASTPSRRASGPPADAKSPAVSKTTIEAASRLPSVPALASALPSLRGCSFPVPPRLSGRSLADGTGPAGSTTRTKKPPTQPSKPDDDDDDDSSNGGDSSASSAAAAPSGAKLGSVASEDLGRKADWSVGSLSSFRALWDELDHVGSSRRSKRSEPQQLPQHLQQIQREAFRRKVGTGSVPVDPADSRSAVALYDRLRRREQEQQQAQQMQQRELEEHRRLLLQLRSRGL